MNLKGCDIFSIAAIVRSLCVRRLVAISSSRVYGKPYFMSYAILLANIPSGESGSYVTISLLCPLLLLLPVPPYAFFICIYVLNYILQFSFLCFTDGFHDIMHICISKFTKTKFFTIIDKNIKAMEELIAVFLETIQPLFFHFGYDDTYF